MTSYQKPILALDVDGVIIPHQSYANDVFDGETHMVFLYDRAGEGYVKMRSDFPEVMQRLREYFDLWWGTGWEDEANEFLLEAMGFEEPLPHIPLKTPLHGSILGKVPKEYFWKTPWLIQWAEDIGRPFALVDDLISPGDIEWAKQRTAAGIPTLLIQTNDIVGWTDDHETQLIEWAKGIRDANGDRAKA